MSFTYDAKRIWISNDGLGPRPNRFCAFAQPVAVAACYMILIIFVGGFYNYTMVSNDLPGSTLNNKIAFDQYFQYSS